MSLSGDRRGDDSYRRTGNARGAACGRQHDGLRLGRRSGGFRGGFVELVKPPLKRGIAAIALRRWGLIDAFGLPGWAFEMQMHMRRVAIPGTNPTQPGAISRHLLAQLLLDRRIDQHAVYPRLRGGKVDEDDVLRPPDRQIHAASIGTDEGVRFDILTLGDGHYRMWPCNVEPDIGIDSELMAGMNAHQRAAARQ